MIKTTVLYGQPKNVDEFEAYYLGTHIPIAQKMKGIARAELTRFEPRFDGSPAKYHRMAEFYFVSVDQMNATLGSPEGQAAVADLPNFATGGVTFLTGVVDR